MLVVVSLIQPVVKPARLLAWGLLPVLLAACSTRSPDRGADEPYGGYAPIVIRRATFPSDPAALPPRAGASAATARAARPEAAPPPAPATRIAAAPAAPSAAPAAAVAAVVPKPPPPKPAEPPELLALVAVPLPTRGVHELAALSDSEALGPIVEMQVPAGLPSAYHPVVNVRPVPRPVACKAVRSRDAKEEKITISCANNGKVAQNVSMTIDAVGLSGVPSADQGKAGWTVGPGKTRQIAVLTTVSRPTRVDIFFTHEAQH